MGDPNPQKKTHNKRVSQTQLKKKKNKKKKKKKKNPQ
jgi:hypothetical protein